MGLDFYITADETLEDKNKEIFYGRKCWDIANRLVSMKADIDEPQKLDIEAYDSLLKDIKKIIGVAYQIAALVDFYDEDAKKKMDNLLEVYIRWHDNTFDTEPPFGYTTSATTIINLWEAASLIHYLYKNNETVWVYASF